MMPYEPEDAKKSRRAPISRPTIIEKEKLSTITVGVKAYAVSLRSQGLGLSNQGRVHAHRGRRQRRAQG